MTDRVGNCLVFLFQVDQRDARMAYLADRLKENWLTSDGDDVQAKQDVSEG